MKKRKRTKFPSTVRPVGNNTILKPASNNTKLGGKARTIITKGHLKGLPLFSLTLEERKTCPPTCHHWDDCFGDNMFMAVRYKHGTDLEKQLAKEIEALNEKYPLGFLIRLHVLGDFYSKSYVRFWKKQLQQYEHLYVFGYTARFEGSIYNDIQRLRRLYPDRWVLRYSTNESYRKEAPYKMYAVGEDFAGDSVICPEMSHPEKVEACIDCGLCWNPNFKKSIKFLTH